jgi:PHYB activation tagged suppressor 1
MARMFMGDMNMVKQVYSDRTGLFPKESWNDNFTRGLGKGMLLIDGDEWKRHRKVINPVLSIDKLKVIYMGYSKSLREIDSPDLQHASL